MCWGFVVGGEYPCFSFYLGCRDCRFGVIPRSRKEAEVSDSLLLQRQTTILRRLENLFNKKRSPMPRIRELMRMMWPLWWRKFMSLFIKLWRMCTKIPTRWWIRLKTFAQTFLSLFQNWTLQSCPGRGLALLDNHGATSQSEETWHFSPFFRNVGQTFMPW